MAGIAVDAAGTTRESMRRASHDAGGTKSVHEVRPHAARAEDGNEAIAIVPRDRADAECVTKAVRTFGNGGLRMPASSLLWRPLRFLRHDRGDQADNAEHETESFDGDDQRRRKARRVGTIERCQLIEEAAVGMATQHSPRGGEDEPPPWRVARAPRADDQERAEQDVIEIRRPGDGQRDQLVPP